LSALIIVANLVIIFTKAGASLKRVNEVLMTESTMKDITNYKEVKSENAPIIEFDNVSFIYKGAGDYSLQDISFKIKKGQTIGIIGSTGAGKTSIINLIPRFYDAVKGKVIIKGLDVKKYKKEELRNMIGVVQQKPVLFTGTIKDNIRWGLENASEEQIEKAAKIAQAHKFIESMKEGYDTVIFHGGVNFSGGQKQRLTIARALVKNPEILILDDCSSALDFATDLELRKALKNNTKDMTVIMVTQRITTIKNADMIIVLNDGKIEGVGTNDELMESCVVYKEIYNSQLQKEDEDEKEDVI
jgi:ATP-binding cassette subfamily B protein